MKKKETVAAAKKRRLATLERAYSNRTFTNPPRAARFRYAEIHAVVRAVIPGRQSERNTADALDKAVAAVCRVVRRRA